MCNESQMEKMMEKSQKWVGTVLLLVTNGNVWCAGMKKNNEKKKGKKNATSKKMFLKLMFLTKNDNDKEKENIVVLFKVYVHICMCLLSVCVYLCMYDKKNRIYFLHGIRA